MLLLDRAWSVLPFKSFDSILNAVDASRILAVGCRQSAYGASEVRSNRGKFLDSLALIVQRCVSATNGHEDTRNTSKQDQGLDELQNGLHSNLLAQLRFCLLAHGFALSGDTNGLRL